MRAYEFMEERFVHRAPKVSLKQVHNWKINKKRRKQAMQKRMELLPRMYGQGDYHQNALDTLEREKAALEVEKKRAEVKQRYAEYLEQKDKSDAVARMAKRGRERRKKCR